MVFHFFDGDAKSLFEIWLQRIFFHTNLSFTKFHDCQLEMVAQFEVHQILFKKMGQYLGNAKGLRKGLENFPQLENSRS